jgi:prepilin peptidase CpaA
MIDKSFLSYAIMMTTSGVLFYAALADLKHYKISNELILALAVLYFVHAGGTGQWMSIPRNGSFAIAIFVVLLWFYSRDWIGGGDVKILTVAFLWVGIDCAFLFSILLVVFTTLHVVGTKLGFATVNRQVCDGKERIPFAPSVAASLTGTFLSGCLGP